MIVDIPLKNRNQLYKSVLRLFNFSMELTENELNVVSDILKYNVKIIDKESRKLLKGEKRTIYNLNNYIKRLKSKGVLVIINNELILHPRITSAVKESEFIFRFNINE